MPEKQQYWPAAGEDSSLYSLPRDSIMVEVAENDPVEDTSAINHSNNFFSEKETVNKITPEEKKVNGNDWIFYLLLAGFIFLAIIRVFHQRRLGMIFQGIYARNYASQLLREGNIYNERISVFLFIIYIISTSLFIYMVMVRFSDIFSFDPRPVMVIPIASFLIVYWFAKVLFIRLTSVIFTTQQRSREYLITIFLINMVNGMVLLSLLIPIVYLDGTIFLFIGIGYLIISFLLKLIKGVVIGLSYIKFSRLHLFLYLCTLEILPLLIITKFIQLNLVG